jgi:murein DD-endopeptidase MepM/ murein hydrolase activator NlpD
VQVTPKKPLLGDTLSVVVRSNNSAFRDSPTVTVNRKSYPAFAIAPGVFRAFIPTTPLQTVGRREIRIASEGKVRNIAVWVANRQFPVQRISFRPGKAALQATELELSRVAAFKSLVTPQKFWHGPFLKPNRGRISTIYGVRRYYNGKFAKDYYHRGVDYAGPVGSPVVAPAAGRVSLVGLESQGFRVHGNIVGIDHGQGVTSVFLHLSRIYVREGDFVKAGHPIGAVGSTGASTGPHLHWGFYVQGESVDPTPWREQKMY